MAMKWDHAGGSTFAHLQRLSIDFYEREMAGRLMTRMTTDVDAFSTLLQSGLITATVSLFTLVGVGAAMLFWNIELGLVALSVVIPLFFATAAYRRLSSRAYERARERIAIVNASMQESLSGVRESQAFVRENRNRKEFRSLAGGYLEARVDAQRLVSLYFPFVEFLADIAAVLVLGVGTVLIARDSLTAGELVGFLLYLDLFFNPIQQLSQTFDSYQQAGASMAQINGLMSTRPLVALPESPVEPPRLTGQISFERVRFAYPAAGPDRFALKGVDLTVLPGQTVALVGETGAGKSTIIKLLTRFYDPTGGSVSVDGIDLRDIDLAGYRHQLDPAILLLDEATSNLDLGTEARVSAAMGVVASGRTTVLIAHRLQTAMHADRIVVMDDGRVIEDGTHSQLLSRGGRYADMWQAFADGSVSGGGQVEAAPAH